jgi:hypothetical protein
VSNLRQDSERAAYFARQADAARLELARADGKANTLLTVAGTVFSVIAALGLLTAGKLGVIGIVGVSASVAGLCAAAVTLLLAVLPTLAPRGQGVAFTVLAGYTVSQADQVWDALPADLGPVSCAEAIRLSGIAYTKFERIRTATRLMIAAVVVLGVTAVALVALP